MIIDKMQELRNLTSQEKVVVQHIIENPKDLLDMNVNQLAQASYTSASTVIRLCKKLDVKGFVELKFIYASEYPEMMRQKHIIKEKPFEDALNMDDIIDVIPMIYERSLSHTKSLLSRNTIIRVTNLMKQAQRIEIYGDSFNYDLAKLMAYRFESVQKDCFVYNAVHWEHIKSLKHRKVNTIAILLSHTGKNPMVVDAAHMLKKYGIRTISISGNRHMQLADITDENIQIMSSDNELEMKTVKYCIGVQYILDICVSSLLVHQIGNIDKVLVSLKEEAY